VEALSTAPDLWRAEGRRGCVTKAPRLPGRDPGRAAGIDALSERCIDIRPASKSQELLRLRRQRQVERICRIPRLVFELIEQLDRDHDLGSDLDRQLERFSGLDLEIVRAVGGDRFPPIPLRLVGGDR
jgi:hypothetical protein